MTLKRGVALFIPHGGGPMPLLGDPHHKELIDILPKLGSWIPKESKAVLVLSAHWEKEPTLNTKNSLLYDYYGFPPESYEVSFDVKLDENYQSLVERHLQEKGIKVKKEARGWDHGVFVPLKLMNLSIPLMQLSIPTSQDPETLWQYGEALEGLLDKGISIIGSGMTFHNLPMLFSGADLKTYNAPFEAKLDEVMKLGKDDRKNAVLNWRTWPGSYDCQPRGNEEHFSPLIICAAMGNLLSSSRIEIMKVICGIYLFQ
jgi:aromatic ring-opening dioxygenase catalytic subunit (LigB family)